MKAMSQHLRISQFVTTYGPGALIEGTEGPRVILRSDIGLFNNIPRIAPSDFEISDQRMSMGLLNGSRIYRLPSNAELSLPQHRFIYRTNPFPRWKLCLNFPAHRGDFYVLHSGRDCPECGNIGPRGREAIRFIKACPNGHMDEVDWYLLAHGFRATCDHSEWFRWFGGGGALSAVIIQCPKCDASETTLGQAYGQSWNCGGRFPEQEPLLTPPHRPGCKAEAKIIQRQASNLRINQLLTLFSIPPRHTNLHNLLQLNPVYAALVGSKPSSLKELKQIVDNLACSNLISTNVAEEITRHSWQELREAMLDVQSPIPPSYNQLIQEEFQALITGSVKGIPPAKIHAAKSQTIIEVDPHRVRRFKIGPKGSTFRVTPVLRLRTVTVQQGYRRDVDTSKIPKLVDVAFRDPTDPQQMWYPGVEFPGEGIFILFDENNGWNFSVSGTTARKWLQAYANSQDYQEDVFRDPLNRVELHPTFVWWHTLSHLLIRAIAAEAGYSSASISERIYFEEKPSGSRGGILLYATQPGSEGTLGGLIAVAPYFHDILETSFDQAQICSGDPLCLEQSFSEGHCNGAACYSCLLLSETSCRHRNMWLDRKLILENM